MNDSTDSAGNGRPTETDSNGSSDASVHDDSGDSESTDTTSGLESQFEIVATNYVGTRAESASVTIENRTVTVTGALSGSNSCYTARLDGVTMEDRTLVVRIESYEDTSEEGCRTGIIEIEYVTNVEMTGDLPTSVRVEHNGEHVMTERPS